MTLTDPATVAAELVIGVIGGLVSTGVFLAYQRWVTDYARWPYQVSHREDPDTQVSGNFTARVSIRNRTSTSTQFLINFRLSNGELCIPRSCCEEEAAHRIEGWGSVPPGDAREYEFYPDIHQLPIVGVKLVAKAPTQRGYRELDYSFEQPFGPLVSLAGIPGCS